MLTLDVWKIIERSVTERLKYYLESKKLIFQYQSGFREGRGTMDPVVCLEEEIRKAQVKEKSLVLVFVDVVKTQYSLEGVLTDYIKNITNQRKNVL